METEERTAKGKQNSQPEFIVDNFILDLNQDAEERILTLKRDQIFKLLIYKELINTVLSNNENAIHVAKAYARLLTETRTLNEVQKPRKI